MTPRGSIFLYSFPRPNFLESIWPKNLELSWQHCVLAQCTAFHLLQQISVAERRIKYSTHWQRRLLSSDVTWFTWYGSTVCSFRYTQIFISHFNSIASSFSTKSSPCGKFSSKCGVRQRGVGGWKDRPHVVTHMWSSTYTSTFLPSLLTVLKISEWFDFLLNS
jgi:hypothetical protein